MPPRTVVLIVAALIVDRHRCPYARRARPTTAGPALAAAEPCARVLDVVFLARGRSRPGCVGARGRRGPGTRSAACRSSCSPCRIMGFDLYGRPHPGQCAFHENGILMHDDRRPVFRRWDEIERLRVAGRHADVPSRRQGPRTRGRGAGHRRSSRASRRRAGRHRAPPARVSGGPAPPHPPEWRHVDVQETCWSSRRSASCSPRQRSGRTGSSSSRAASSCGSERGTRARAFTPWARAWAWRARRSASRPTAW